MELEQTDYILGYWFASDGENNWYLLMVKRGDKWVGQQTFRYNADEEDPFSDKDDKSIWDITFPGNENEESIIDKINLVFTFIKIKFNDFNDHFLVRGDVSKFLDIAKTKHYLHLKEEKI